MADSQSTAFRVNVLKRLLCARRGTKLTTDELAVAALRGRCYSQSCGVHEETGTERLSPGHRAATPGCSGCQGTARALAG